MLAKINKIGYVILFMLLIILLCVVFCACDNNIGNTGNNGGLSNVEYDEETYPIIAKTEDPDGNIIKDIQFGDFVIRKTEIVLTSKIEYNIIAYTGTGSNLVFPDKYAGHDYTLKSDVFFCENNENDNNEKISRHYSCVDFHNIKYIEGLRDNNVIIDKVICKDTQISQIKNIMEETKELEVFATQKESIIFNNSKQLEKLVIKQWQGIQVTRTIALTGNVALDSFSVVIDKSMYNIKLDYAARIETMIIEEGAFVSSGYENVTCLTIGNRSVDLESILMGTNSIKILNITNYDRPIYATRDVFFNYSNNYFKNNIEEINASEDNEIYKTIDGVLYNKDVTELVIYPMGKKDSEYIVPNGISKINAALLINDYIKTINLNTAEYYYSFGRGVGSYNSPFSNLTALEEIRVSDNHQYYYAKDGVLYDKLWNRLIYYPQAKTVDKYIVPDFVTMIDDDAFDDNCNLTHIIVSGNAVNIISALRNLNKLESVEVKDNFTTIYYQTFANCVNLKEMKLCKSVEYIGEDAFYGCEALTEIIYTGSMADWGAIDKSKKWNNGANITRIKCEDGNIDLLV